MLFDQRGCRDQDKDRDGQDALYGLAAAVPPALALCGVAALIVNMLR